MPKYAISVSLQASSQPQHVTDPHLHTLDDMLCVYRIVVKDKTSSETFTSLVFKADTAITNF